MAEEVELNSNLFQKQLNGKHMFDDKLMLNMLVDTPPVSHNRLLANIIKVYDSPIVRAYVKVRFTIIDTNILNILALCLRGKRKILDVGCGFGLFGCYLAALYPEVSYFGCDLDPGRIDLANEAARRLNLNNASFHCKDAGQLSLNDRFDGIIMIDLLHHLNDDTKASLLATCAKLLSDNGRLIIKDVTMRPFLKLAFTWLLDVLVTRGLDMWYWDEKRFHKALAKHFMEVHSFPITHWLPYPHITYLCETPHSLADK